MSSPRPTLDFGTLKDLHARKRLQLQTSVGLTGTAHLDNDPVALVTELIRLAEIGQKVEQQAAVKVLHLKDQLQ